MAQIVARSSPNAPNSSSHNDLPPNLTANKSSQLFLLEGVHVAITALESESRFVSDPVVRQVFTAELIRQLLNSMVLISAGYTHSNFDVFAQLSACTR